MAVRTDAQEERIATFRSVMNVIALLDLEPPRRRALSEAVNLRALLPTTLDFDRRDDPWTEFLTGPTGSRRDH